MAQKVFLTKSGMANFSCPECGRTRQMDVKKFRRSEKEVRLKCTCTCKHVFSVVLERRKYLRREVDLKGVLLFNGKRYPVSVVDISRYGLRIRTKGRIELKRLDQVALEFVLDDAANSTVTKDILVRTVQHPEIGCEFLAKEHYDKLGTYLLFHFK